MLSCTRELTLGSAHTCKVLNRDDKNYQQINYMKFGLVLLEEKFSKFKNVYIWTILLCLDLTEGVSCTLSNDKMATLCRD